MSPEEAKNWIEVARYAIDTLWPLLVAAGIVSPLASKRVRKGIGDALSKEKEKPQ